MHRRYFCVLDGLTRISRRRGSGSSVLSAGCWTAWPDLGERWPSRLVATAAEDRLNTYGRNLWLLGIWVEQNVLEKIPFYYRYKEFTDESTNAHVPELCLER